MFNNIYHAVGDWIAAKVASGATALAKARTTIVANRSELIRGSVLNPHDHPGRSTAQNSRIEEAHTRYEQKLAQALAEREATVDSIAAT